MAELGLCFDHFTVDEQHVEAVTIYRGTSLCENCAKSWRLAEAADRPG